MIKRKKQSKKQQPQKKKDLGLNSAIDTLNKKFGKNTVHFGINNDCDKRN